MMILDTCALLWLASGDSQLSAATRSAIKNASMVHVSAITGFEIALKCRSGKLELPAAPREWFAETLAHHDLTSMPLDMESCIEAAQLPPIHNDPCDRFIIAIARKNNWPVVTADAIFPKYGVEVLI